MIDTHCHLTYEPLFERIDEVLAGAAVAGVDRMISVGTAPDDAQRAVALAEGHDNLFATAGIHPHYAAKWADVEDVAARLEALLDHPRVVAIGEMGLDNHYDDPPLPKQRKILQIQLEVAKGLSASTPIIIHNRDATEEMLHILQDSGLAPERFVFHCFTGDAEELASILDFGAMVSFTGIVTFGSARDLSRCAATVPIDRVMVETDAPYLTPEPHRKCRPNEPRYIPHVAAHLAAARGMASEDFITQVDANAERFFGIGSAKVEGAEG